MGQVCNMFRMRVFPVHHRDRLVSYTLFLSTSEKLQPTFSQLEKFGLKGSPFVIIAVVGQELVAAGHFSAAVTILEAALKVSNMSIPRTTI